MQIVDHDYDGTVPFEHADAGEQFGTGGETVGAIRFAPRVSDSGRHRRPELLDHAEVQLDLVFVTARPKRRGTAYTMKEMPQ